MHTCVLSKVRPSYRGMLAAILGLGVVSQVSAGAAPNSPPNFILILCDNLGYGDLGCYGSRLHRTPHVDRLATEGLRLTDFYVSSGVCTPSRASFMTGCYAQRVNLHVSEHGAAVLQPVSSKGLHPQEVTLAEVLKARGYATACFGKWHLGDQLVFLPTRQGFDEFFGLPYSDDMTPRPGKNWPPLPLMRGEKVIEAPVDRSLLTQRLTHEAVAFIERHRERPFFLYLPQAMPGSTDHPFASEAFRGRSANGAYGDAVEELDWSTGEILSALKRHGLEERTLLIFTSDNGAPQRNPPQGSNQPLAGWGYTTAEGGMRVPCLLRWPGQIPAGQVCSELVTAMDLLPTLARLAEADLPTDRVLDGKDVWPLFAGQPGARSPHEAFYYYHMDQLQAVRAGKWKLYLPREAARRGASAGSPTPLLLFDLSQDLAEAHNLAAEHPEVVQRLLALAERARHDLGDRHQPGAGQRPAGHEPHPTPRLLED